MLGDMSVAKDTYTRIVHTSSVSSSVSKLSSGLQT